MQIKLLRAMTRSAVFELNNTSCYYAPSPFTVLLDGSPVRQDCKTNVFSLYGWSLAANIPFACRMPPNSAS